MGYFVRAVEYASLKEATAAIPVLPAVIYARSSKHNVTYQEALDYYTERTDARKAASSDIYMVRQKEYVSLRDAMCSTNQTGSNA